MKATRGLRQRDPFSPFISTIVVDILSRMMIKAKESSLLKGFIVGSDKIRVSFMPIKKKKD